MKHPHLIPRKSGNRTYFHFRSKIPLDLISTFSGRKEFQISLKDVSNKETLLVSALLQTLIAQLFYDIRKGMKERRSIERMMSRCFTWFPIGGLGEPNI